MKTKHPLPEAIYLAVEAVEKTLSASILNNRKRFDIGQFKVNIGYDCGTIHCAGGWFAVALCDTQKEISFTDGADIFASIIGMKDRWSLRRWAHNSPSIWGNTNGFELFDKNIAYADKGKIGSRTMQDVLNHWRRVAQRIEQYNAEPK